MIRYRLARPGGEYNRLYALTKRELGAREELGWPIVVAEEDGKVIGFLATFPTDEALIAGPLVIEGGRRPRVFLHLVDAYENLLMALGIKRYAFRVDKSNEKHLKRMERLGFEKLGETDTFVSFKREIAR